MDIFNILSLVGGLALFLYGMNIMGGALEKQAGGKFKQVLEKITANPLSGVLLGVAVTGVIQSSSATTVMVVGLVNSGMMTLENSVGIIMGANVGTTVTAWILSLAGIESSNVFIQLLKPSSFSPVLAGIGIVLVMMAKSDKKKDLGQILLGFAVLMFGMDTMSAAVKPLAAMEGFTNILTYFHNPILGVLTGALVTGIIQSSSASIGILQAMSLTGAITYGAAIPIIMGQNIGTCVTALLSSAGTNTNAKRAAFVHLYFNIIGVTVFMVLFYAFDAIWGWTFLESPIGAVQIAVVHTVFNLLNTALQLPFRKVLVRLAELTVPEGAADKKLQLLDDRFLSTPSFAVAQCRDLTVSMAEISRDNIYRAMELVKKFSESEAKKVLEAEDEVDHYEDKLGTYMVKLSSKSMSLEDSRNVSKLLHCISDLERIADHSVNIMRNGEEMHQKDIHFSDEARRDLDIMYDAVKEIVGLAVDAFINDDIGLAAQVEPLEQVIDTLKVQLKARHVARLQRGECTTMLGFVFTDLITNFERVADHCSNIAVAVIQVSVDSFDTHLYLNTLKNSDDATFEKYYGKYRSKYKLT